MTDDNSEFEVQTPDGNTYFLTAPKDTPPEKIQQAAQELVKQQYTSGGALVRGAAQGITFGFGDEIYGGIKGLGSVLSGNDFVSAYQKARDEQRAANQLSNEAHPNMYFAGELGGGIATSLGAGGLARGVVGIGSKILPRAVGATEATTAATNTGAATARNLALRGAAEGGAYGFGTSEGDLENQLSDAGTSALAGGVIGAALPKVTQAGGAVLGGLRNVYDIKVNPEKFVDKKIAQNAFRDMGQEVITPGINPLENAEKSLQAAAERGDKQLMLGDVAGKNLQNLFRQAADMPNAKVNKLNEVLDRRQMVQGNNIEESIIKNLSNGKDFHKSETALIKEREDASKPFFDLAYKTETPVTMKLKRVLVRPEMRNLMQVTEKELRNRGVRINKMSLTEQLHEMKLQLDDQIGAAKLAEKMGNSSADAVKARTLTILKKDFLNAIDNKAYKQALNKFAGPSALLRAGQEGFDDLLDKSMNAELIKNKLADMTQSEIEQWRKGAARALIDKVRSMPFMNDKIKTTFDNKEMREKFKAIFPSNKDRGNFLRDLKRERQKSGFRNKIQGGSKTSANLAAMQEAGNEVEAAKTAVDAVTASKGNLDALVRLYQRGKNYVTGMTPRVAAGITERAMSGQGQAGSIGSQGVQNALQSLQARKDIEKKIANYLARPLTVGSSIGLDTEQPVFRGKFRSR